jgi:hypothetical protein
MARTALGPVHLSKVSKARRKSGLGPRRRPNASGLPPKARQSPSGLDIPERTPRAAPVRPRRNRRLQEAERKAATDPAGISSAQSIKDPITMEVRINEPGPSRYSYRKLEPYQIRLLCVFPGAEDEELRGEITHVPLNDCPPIRSTLLCLGRPDVLTQSIYSRQQICRNHGVSLAGIERYTTRKQSEPIDMGRWDLHVFLSNCN